MKLKTIKCKGRAYRGVKGLAAAFRKHPSTVARRLRDGWTSEQAVGLVSRKRRGHGTVVQFQGKTYRSISEAANAQGLRPSMIIARVSRLGYSIEEALTGVLRKRTATAAKPFKFRGNKFRSREAFALHYGLRWSNVTRRVSRGWTMEQALGIEDAPPRFRDFDGHARDHKWKRTQHVDGLVEPVPDADGFKLYLIKKKHHQKVYVGMTIASLKNRLKQHFSAARRGRKNALSNAINHYGEDAFSIHLIRKDAKNFAVLQNQEIAEIRKRNSIRRGYNSASGGSLGTSKSIVVAGRRFPSMAQAAEFHQIDAAVFGLRIGRLGWSPEEAAGLVEKEWASKPITVQVGGSSFPSFNDAARAHGTAPNVAHRRYRYSGWTLEEAVGFHPRPVLRTPKGMTIRISGNEYPSLAAAGRELGISAVAFRRRMREGKTSDESHASSNNGRWDIMFDRLLACKDRHGHWNVPRSDKQLIGWMGTQRMAYKKQQLSQARIHRLSQIEFVWNPRSAV